MATARNHHMELSSHKEITQIKNALEKILDKMKSQTNYCPTVQELEKHAESIINFINKHDKEIKHAKAHLKNAVIDLTEVPVMHPNMQKIAIQTCVKVSIDNIEKFFNAC